MARRLVVLSLGGRGLAGSEGLLVVMEMNRYKDSDASRDPADGTSCWS